ncbi:MAG TPA: MIT C-terminal domain-containing protein, partial [Candidatus Tectomicrobia bacterium]
DAREEDEDPPTFAQVREKEETRLRAEIRRTLNELLDETALKEEDGYYYIEQLDALKIHFTSARWFDEGKVEASGIKDVKDALFEVLSENYHLQQLVDHLERTMHATQSRLRAFFRERRLVMDTEFDPQKVERSIKELECQLSSHLDRFEERMQGLKACHDTEQAALGELMDANVARMQLIARGVLSEYEKTDVAKHWKTLRYGYWGYLSDVGVRVADKVFPIMEVALTRQLKPFRDFLSLASASLDGLQSDIVQLEAQSALAGLPKIEFGEAKRQFMLTYGEELEAFVSAHKDAIVQVLEEFATGELKERLSGVKEEVTNVWGPGTTKGQNALLRDFYDDIGTSLAEALEAFLTQRLAAFATLLSTNAATVFPKLRVAVESLLLMRKQVIHDQLQLQTVEARNSLHRYLDKGLTVLEEHHVVGDEGSSDVRETLAETTITLGEDTTGYSYASLFEAYVKHAEHLEIKEPYLRSRYQLDNFQRLCELVARSGKTRTIMLTTGTLDGDDEDQADARLEDIRRYLMSRDIALRWRRDATLHAREIKTSDGWLILSDRGLDIYKKPESHNAFGHSDQALRQCKHTQIHIRRVV